MHEFCVYEIGVRGEVDGNDLNAASPLQIRVVGMDGTATVCKTCSDQSGLIGLIRHLHGRGFVLLSVRRLS